MSGSLFKVNRFFVPLSQLLMFATAAADGGWAGAVLEPLAAPLAPAAVTHWLKAEPVAEVKVARSGGGGVVALAPVVVVTTQADELDALGIMGQGVSLREALRDVDAGGTVQFDPAVFNGGSVAANTISLSLGEFRLDKSYTVDASGLSAPVIIQANGLSRHFTVYPGKAVGLKRLTLIGGNVSAEPAFREGGALYCSGEISLTDCRLAGNTAGTYGGGIFCYAVRGNAAVSLLRCAVEGNSAPFNGAGLINWADAGYSATMTLEASTISGNAATRSGVSSGGGVMNYSTNGAAALIIRRSTLQGNVAGSGAGLMNIPNNANASCVVTLEQVTIAENTPPNGDGAAAGLRSYVYSGSSALTLVNTILAGNIATSWDDLYVDGGSITSLGGNVIGINHEVVALGTDRFGSEAVPLPPLLAPLGDYGGATRTMPLLPGSVARNGGVTQGAGPIVDQRGYGIQGVPDSGAYEVGNLQNYAGWIWERLPLGTTEAMHAEGLDFDGDGVSNYQEWLADTLPTNAGSFFQGTINTVSGGLEITFQSALGRNYALMTTSTLAAQSWVPTGQTAVGNGQVMSFTVDPAEAVRKFFRVDVGL